MNEETQTPPWVLSQDDQPKKLVERPVGEPVLDPNERPVETEQPSSEG